MRASIEGCEVRKEHLSCLKEASVERSLVASAWAGEVEVSLRGASTSNGKPLQRRAAESRWYRSKVGDQDVWVEQGLEGGQSMGKDVTTST